MFRSYGPRRRLTPEETAANAAAKVAREAHAMTCQCCARHILANTGVIAHHGYTRPYEGMQTGSCWGARALPWEADRKRLGELIEWLKTLLARHQASRKLVAAEKQPITLVYMENKRLVGYGSKRQDIHVQVTRATWDVVLDEHKPKGLFPYHYEVWTFDKALERDLVNRDGDIRRIKSDITMQEKRYAGWKKTHQWKGEAWVKI